MSWSGIFFIIVSIGRTVNKEISLPAFQESPESRQFQIHKDFLAVFGILAFVLENIRMYIDWPATDGISCNVNCFRKFVQCTYNVLTLCAASTIMLERKGAVIMATTNITMRIDENLKAQLQELVSNLGMDMTTFFTISAKQAVREQRIPFTVSMNIPNEETKEAIEEVRQMKRNSSYGKAYTDVDEMMRDLLE